MFDYKAYSIFRIWVSNQRKMIWIKNILFDDDIMYIQCSRRWLDVNNSWIDIENHLQISKSEILSLCVENKNRK